MHTQLTLEKSDAFSLSAASDGKTIIIIPLEVLKRAYCEYVAAQVSRLTPEGARIQ